ncbi:hypothetical protein BU24DRAFT_429030 [Aaosphaeria arxii CBS 175.79]|uniref:Uncharacterized protein n=1 Tax=Aaosphaeria arxii CBS 175.79 TaxID=1450172 RepID=A0A6A5X8L1_9PLEO|nr:uncharacterized protein BU24DRAFT_429030 [Aaosphaeria arxii CBS 175.79]KAF2009094.1 hypothetical protein BU24DRAFT_429030 [Aaosphaeria arxii CBS 175.79]
MAATNSINVAVTGNAEFAQFDWNTSWSVLEALPEVVNRPGKRDIHIWKYSRVTRDTYDDVRRVSREIWDGKRSVFLSDSQTDEEDSKDVPIHVSDDAGLYFCEFRLYSSLAETLLQECYSGKRGHVAFQHLPQYNSPEAIDLARNIAVAYISALADDRLLDGA